MKIGEWTWSTEFSWPKLGLMVILVVAILWLGLHFFIGSDVQIQTKAWLLQDLSECKLVDIYLVGGLLVLLNRLLR